MWLIYSLLAMFLLVARRSTEKTLSNKVPSTALAWLQQATALPFMALMLPFAVWYNPFELSGVFLSLLLLYAILAAVDLLLYYKALQVGDISLIAPLINLTAVSSIAGSYLLLEQQPNIYGVSGAAMIVAGAFFVTKHRQKKSSTAINNSMAILLILLVVVLRGGYAPLKVTLLRETNAIYLNFVSSFLTVPIIVTLLLLQQKSNKQARRAFDSALFQTIKTHKFALTFIGLTMALNLYFTLSARNLAPNAGYVTAIKGAQVLPITFIGVILFKEHVTFRQWIGIALISLGLIAFLFS